MVAAVYRLFPTKLYNCYIQTQENQIRSTDQLENQMFFSPSHHLLEILSRYCPLLLEFFGSICIWANDAILDGTFLKASSCTSLEDGVLFLLESHWLAAFAQ